MPSQSQWEAVALVWEMLERHGLHESHLLRLQDWLKSPALVVGAGQGLLMEALGVIGLESVEGLDFSSAMAAAAWQRRRQPVTVGDATNMPFEDRRFASIVCATGVLNPHDAAQMERVREEMLRVTAAGGTWLVALFRPSAEFAEPGVALGYFRGGTQYHDRIYELWQYRADEVELASRIANWTNCSPAAAAERIHTWQPVLEGLCDWVEGFRNRLEWLGRDVERELPQVLSWRISGMTSTELPAAFRHPRLQLVQELYDEAAATQIYVFQL